MRCQRNAVSNNMNSNTKHTLSKNVNKNNVVMYIENPTMISFV